MISSLVSKMSTPPSSTLGFAGKRPAVRIHWMTSIHPPQVGPVTAEERPAQTQGSVGSRSPYAVSAAGSDQSLPMSSDSHGSLTSSRPPVDNAAQSDARWHGSTA